MKPQHYVVDAFLNCHCALASSRPVLLFTNVLEECHLIGTHLFCSHCHSWIH